MRYENLIVSNLALLDLPKIKYDQAKKSFKEKIFERLLVYDQMPDNNFSEVLKEALDVPTDPSFDITFPNTYKVFVEKGNVRTKWEKIRHDFNFFIRAEVKRRNKQNPYYIENISDINGYDKIPDFSRQKHGQAWQYDVLFKEIQIFAGEAFELSRNYKAENDKDLFKLKVNSILTAEKIIFALNNIENYHNFLEHETTTINLKICLDGLKAAFIFLNRSIETLHKMRWSDESKNNIINQNISLGDKIIDILKKRIFEIEKKLMLFMANDFEN